MKKFVTPFFLKVIFFLPDGRCPVYYPVHSVFLEPYLFDSMVHKTHFFLKFDGVQRCLAEYSGI